MILVTGAAGFIGYHLTRKLLERGDQVVGLDNFNDYYDVQLKQARLKQIASPNFTFYQMDICDREGMKTLFEKHAVTSVCHLAAQVGVRYSLVNPYAYQKCNGEGFLNIIELAREFKTANFVYASSSSVYGKSKTFPFSTEDRADTPLSYYGVTKRANELTAFSYHHLYNLPVTGLRFFTVYGPWGRPDMAPFLFTKKVIEGTPIDVFAHGKAKRSFTYIDDIIQGVIVTLDHPKPWALYNIGSDRTEDLERFIEVIETCVGKKAIRNYLPPQPGDMAETWADIEPLRKEHGYHPTTTIEQGMRLFVEWYRKYYKV